MSWQQYVDTQLVATRAIAEACLLGKADAAVWGMTPNFQPRGYKAKVLQADGVTETDTDINEAADLVGFANTGTKSANGFRVNGKKYTVLRTFRDNEYGKLVVYGKGKACGICLVATARAIIIGTWDQQKDANHNAANCNTACENLGKYLLSVGY